jgi:glutamate N-acetyltransferase/amino-acid N-acetyltransferase
MKGLPKGFSLSTAEAAIKHAHRADLALIHSDTDASVAGVFTSNKVKAAPVVLDMQRVRSGKARSVIVNSGNANACTGDQGLADARETASLIAGVLGVPDNRVLVCSTGVIGVTMPMDRIRNSVLGLVAGLGKSGIEDAARAIMTTDKFPKFLSRKITVGGKRGTIVALCKGAGMIEPNMATMLCFVLTDLAVEPKALKAALKEAVERSFNRITVDGDMSTNDTVLILANGLAGNKPLNTRSDDFGPFHRVLSSMLLELAKMIVRDGEGATKVVEIEVSGAKTDAQALKGAKAVANSLLVKTALFGADPNWGRIIAALGYAGIELNERKTDISFGKTRVVKGGLFTGRSGSLELKKKEIKITCHLGLGKGTARVLTCDLTYDYIKINAEYTT